MVKKKVKSRSTKKKPTRKKTVKRKAVKKKTVKRKATKKKATKKKAVKRKAVKKRVVKKKAVKRRSPPRRDRAAKLRTTSRERVYNLTREVPEYHYFVLANGKPVKHVAELASLLDQIEDHIFHHHVSAGKNDFNAWVKDVFDDVELARKMSGAKDKKHLQLVIYKHLAGHEE